MDRVGIRARVIVGFKVRITVNFKFMVWVMDKVKDRINVMYRIAVKFMVKVSVKVMVRGRKKMNAIPMGASLIRIGEHKGKVIRIYQKYDQVFVSESKKNREACQDSWAIKTIPERLRDFVLNELYSRDSVITKDIHKCFWAR